jgi:uncharacterized protein (TIGR00290 family)
MIAFINWSGGKDSALAFYKAKQKGITIDTLLTSVNAATDRVSMHGVRREILMQQAASIGLPLQTIELPEMPGMQAYEEAVREKHRQLKAAGFTQAIFGDLFLEDLKAYREALLAKDNLQGVFPIWKMSSSEVMEEFMAAGFKAIIVCVNSSFLPKEFCGRLLDENFLRDLPPGVDSCGENGEYHSFVFDGPVFQYPINFTKGDVVFREYTAPKTDDCFTTPKAAVGFYFQDLLPH